MPRRYHVSSALNRASIREHGLDWRRMGAARGIAGSERPEVDGIFVCEELFTVDFFVRMNNTGGPIDVWAIDGVDDELVESGTGFGYVPRVIPAGRLTLLEQDARRDDPTPEDSGGAYRSTLSIEWDD